MTRPLLIRLTLPLTPSDCYLPIPGGGRTWDGCTFVVNPPDDEPCDFWFVLGFALERERALVAPANTAFLCGEPLAKKQFPRRFYQQFHHVVDTHNYSRHPGLVLYQPCLGWGITWSYDRLQSFTAPPKINKIGVVCSATAKTPGQRARLRFLKKLKELLGDDLVHFGRGFTPVADKMDAIAPYRLQLVMENSISPHYCTEKLADAYLGWGFPFYAGCPNADDYYPAASFQTISLKDPAGAAQLIKQRLATAVTPAETAAVAQARDLALNKYNPILRCAQLARAWHVEQPPCSVEIRTYKAFRFWDRLLRLRG